MTQNKMAAIAATLTLAEDIDKGKIDPAQLDAELVGRCRELFGVVVGEDDPLFDLQRDVCRQVLTAGGLSADEIAEWAAVARQRAQRREIASGGPPVTHEPLSSASGPLSPEINDTPQWPEA